MSTDTRNSGGNALVFVLGMHRSGTSALCAALAAAGASFGDDLLEAMAGVNEAGFWEDRRLVELNDQLLQLAGCHWYSAGLDCAGIDWASSRFDAPRPAARDLLQQGFGPGPVRAAKDPRLCLTLPFWLALCRDLDIDVQCCVIGRPALEVAASLEKRDGFPPGYGLRLAAVYQHCLARHLPERHLVISYGELLAQPAGVIEQLFATEGLALNPAAVTQSQAVRVDLRHQSLAGEGPLCQPNPEPAALMAAIEANYPRESVLAAFAEEMVQRGQQLTEIGEAHSTALATLDERGADIDRLAAELRAALATIGQRDSEIAEFDRRLAETGGHLQEALDTLDERDRQISELDGRLQEEGRMHGEALAHIRRTDERLERLFASPVIGPVFRLAWSRQCRLDSEE